MSSICFFNEAKPALGLYMVPTLQAPALRQLGDRVRTAIREPDRGDEISPPSLLLNTATSSSPPPLSGRSSSANMGGKDKDIFVHAAFSAHGQRDDYEGATRNVTLDEDAGLSDSSVTGEKLRGIVDNTLLEVNRILEEFSEATDSCCTTGIKAGGDPKHKQFARCNHAHQRQPKEALPFHLRDNATAGVPGTPSSPVSPAVAQSKTGERAPSPASPTTAKPADVGTLTNVKSFPQDMTATPVYVGGSLYGRGPFGSIGTCSACPVLAQASTAGSASEPCGKTQEAMADETVVNSYATASTHDTASAPSVMNPAPSQFKVYGKSEDDWAGIIGAHAAYRATEIAAVPTSKPSALRHIPSRTRAHAAAGINVPEATQATVKGVPPLPTTTRSVFTRGMPFSSPASNAIVGRPLLPADRHTTGGVAELLPLRRTTPSPLFATGANASVQPLSLKKTAAKGQRSCDNNVTRVIPVPVSHRAAAERTIATATSPTLYDTTVPPLAHAAVVAPVTMEDPLRPGEVTSKGVPQSKTSPTVYLTYRTVRADARKSSSTAPAAGCARPAPVVESFPHHEEGRVRDAGPHKQYQPALPPATDAINLICTEKNSSNSRQTMSGRIATKGTPMRGSDGSMPSLPSPPTRAPAPPHKGKGLAGMEQGNSTGPSRWTRVATSSTVFGTMSANATATAPSPPHSDNYKNGYDIYGFRDPKQSSKRQAWLRLAKADIKRVNKEMECARADCALRYHQMQHFRATGWCYHADWGAEISRRAAVAPPLREKDAREALEAARFDKFSSEAGVRDAEGYYRLAMARLEDATSRLFDLVEAMEEAERVIRTHDGLEVKFPSLLIRDGQDGGLKWFEVGKVDGKHGREWALPSENEDGTIILATRKRSRSTECVLELGDTDEDGHNDKLCHQNRRPVRSVLTEEQAQQAAVKGFEAEQALPEKKAKHSAVLPPEDSGGQNLSREKRRLHDSKRHFLLHALEAATSRVRKTNEEVNDLSMAAGNARRDIEDARNHPTVLAAADELLRAERTHKTTARNVHYALAWLRRASDTQASVRAWERQARENIARVTEEWTKIRHECDAARLTAHQARAAVSAMPADATEGFVITPHNLFKLLVEESYYIDDDEL